MVIRSLVAHVNRFLILGLVLTPLQLHADGPNTQRGMNKAPQIMTGSRGLTNNSRQANNDRQDREQGNRNQANRSQDNSRNDYFDDRYDHDRTSVALSLNYNRYPDYRYSDRYPVRYSPYSPARPKVIVINNYHRPRPYLRPSFYYRSDLPSGITFAISAGITYAIIDDLYYYRHSGDRYVYVESPPAGSYEVVEEVDDEGTIKPGTVVFGVPGTSKIVTFDDQSYYLDGKDWYLPIAGEAGKYVVVENPLD